MPSTGTRCRAMPGGAEQAAITADHDHQVAGFAQSLPRRSLHAVPGEHLGDVLLEDHMQMAFDEKSLQPADGIQHLGAAQAANDADIAELLH